MALTGKLQALIGATLTGSPELGGASWDIGSDGKITIALADGSAVNQATKVFQDHIAAAGGATTYDLDAGTMVNGLGVAIAAFSRIVALLVIAPAANAAVVSVGGDFILTKYLVPGGDTLANVTIPVHPGGFFFWTAPSATGVAVTASSGDAIVVTPGAPDTADVIIIGS